MPKCAKKRCRRNATQAFDVWNPWPVDRSSRDRQGPTSHYEVCDKHAEEYWPSDVPGYVRRDHSEAIKRDLVPQEVFDG